MQEYRPFLPYGFQFRPSDEELIEHYLIKKVSGTLNQVVPFVEYFIRKCDLYGEKPSEIWKLHGGHFLNIDEDLYFFTQLQKKSSKGSRFNRKVGSSGAWQSEDGAQDIVTRESKLKIGFKKRFRYENKGSKDHGAWIMQEYSLHPSMLPKNQTTNYVLCRLRKNQPTGKEENLASPKKRKRKNIQNKKSDDELEKILTNILNSQVESQSEEAGAVMTMAQEEACCSTDKAMMMSEQVVSAHQCDFNCGTLEINETGGIYYTQNADEQYGLQNNKALSNHQCNPHEGSETTGGIDYSCNTYTVGEQYDVQMAVPDKTLQTWSMLQQQECSNGDPLAGLTEEDFRLIRMTFPGRKFEAAMVSVGEQEARCYTGMKMSEQSLSSNNSLQSDGMDCSISVAQQQQNEEATVMVSEFKQILSDNPIALENGNLERQETLGIIYDVPMEQEAGCYTGMKMSEQNFSGNNSLQTDGVYYSTGDSEQQYEEALTVPYLMIQCEDNTLTQQQINQLTGVANLGCQGEATMVLTSESEQSLSINNGLQSDGMDRSTSVAEKQHEADMVMVSDFKQILSDNQIAMENGNLEGQEIGGIAYNVPMEVGDEILQSEDTVQYEEWSDDLLAEALDDGCTKFS